VCPIWHSEENTILMLGIQKRGKALLLRELNASDDGAKAVLDRNDITLALDLMLATAGLAAAAAEHPVSSEVDQFLATHGVKVCAIMFYALGRC